MPRLEARPGPAGLAATSNRAALGIARSRRRPRAPQPGPAAAREARRPHFALRRASKPARSFRTLRSPPHQWCPVADSVPRLEARPCPPDTPASSTPVVTGVLACGWARRREVQLWLSISNFARNSSMTHSKFGFASLELQRFWGVWKDDRDKLRATFGWRWCRRRPRAPKSGPASATQALPRPSLTSLLCSSISHAIPPRLFQTMNLQRRNCNVFRLY